ncbi:MAG: topoisomerase C-terminal repeat-containing protein, partial [Cyanobacteria bacterium P01_H01_bin.153]
ADLDADQVELLLKQKKEGPEKLGLHSETGEPIYVLVGQYGPYVQLGESTEERPKPKRASLPKGKKLEDVTMEMAEGLLALPRLLGAHPETGKPIKASLGRFGPYVVHDQGKDGKDYRSLKAEDDVLTVTFDRAMELLSQPKAGRGRRKAEPLKELGKHPEDDELIAVYKGPYGLYVKHGKTNAGLPEGKTESDITLEEAIALINAKAGTKKKSTRKKSTAKSGTKSTAKKTTAKKSTAKKSTAKKTTTRKSTTTKRAAASKSTGAKTTTAKKTSTRKKSSTDKKSGTSES